MKFISIKIKDNILSQRLDLRKTRMAASQDYALSIQLARQRLIEHDRSLCTPFKLRFDKLVLGNRRFAYGTPKDSVP